MTLQDYLAFLYIKIERLVYFYMAFETYLFYFLSLSAVFSISFFYFLIVAWVQWCTFPFEKRC